MSTITRPSAASLYLGLNANGQAIGSATGFIVQLDDSSLYLFTNRHVVRGRRQDSDELLSNTGAVPDEVVIQHNESGKPGCWIPKTESLYDSNGSPRWLEHSTLGPSADVVALPLTDTTGIDTYNYDPSNPGPKMPIHPSSSVSIVGFPFGETGGGFFGIWVNGFIATEFSINYNNMPVFLVDSRTRPGQSGSPVLIYKEGTIPLEGGSFVMKPGPAERFLGIYSGRINEQSDLGIVWKIEVLEDIKQNGVPGTE